MSNKSITDIYSLYAEVELDQKEHKIKELAKLLISAMADWPTKNQTSIKEFMVELNIFYGSPLTIDKINNKGIDLSITYNPWRAEARESILEMVTIAKTIMNTDDFESIIKNIIAYYSNKSNSSNLDK